MLVVIGIKIIAMVMMMTIVIITYRARQRGSKKAIKSKSLTLLGIHYRGNEDEMLLVGHPSRLVTLFALQVTTSKRPEGDTTYGPKQHLLPFLFFSFLFYSFLFFSFLFFSFLSFTYIGISLFFTQYKTNEVSQVPESMYVIYYLKGNKYI
jgi:hypothetical protein